MKTFTAVGTFLVALSSSAICQTGQIEIRSANDSGISVVVLFRKHNGNLTQAQIHVPSISIDSAGKITDFTGPVTSMTWLLGNPVKVTKSTLSHGQLFLTTSDHHNYVIYDLQSTMYGKMKDAPRTARSRRRPRH